jgi:hypothetical protein
MPHATDVWVSLSVAVVLGIIAAAIALWPTEQRARKTAPQSVMLRIAAEDPVAGPVPQPAPAKAQSSPTRFTNPFDASEVFEFPPGTTEDAARDLVAEMLLQRARERGIQSVTAKHIHDDRSAALRSSTLISEHF